MTEERNSKTTHMAAPEALDGSTGASPCDCGTVSATEPIWERETLVSGEWAPGKRLLRAIRDYQKAPRRKGILASLRRITAVARHRFWSIVTGADIPLNSHIGGGLLIPHPNGIVIHPDVDIGPNCLIFQQVTLGTRDTDSGVPTVGGHVDIGGGARVLGDIQLGEHAKIGANAVVLTDVPAGATAIGIPARIVPGQRLRTDEASG